MHDNAFATKRFTRTAAQQAIRQISTFRFSGSKILVAMQQITEVTKCILVIYITFQMIALGVNAPAKLLVPLPRPSINYCHVPLK
jgi:hypothetical protein